MVAERTEHQWPRTTRLLETPLPVILNEPSPNPKKNRYGKHLISLSLETVVVVIATVAILLHLVLRYFVG